jgi:LytR cell envelope-related transcriptional attenuator
MLIVGGVIVGVAVLVVALTSLGGGSSNGHGTAGAGTASTGTTTKKTRGSRTSSTTHGEASAPAASPAETHVVVLNGTSTPELAHKLSANLQQSGYAQSHPLDGTPPGSHPATVVEYASGRRADAMHVAQALEVTRIQPMEAAVSSLVGSATVVVIAGLDKATPPVSGGGEAATPTGATP